ncbi:MAG: hypothetical protein HWN81_00895 [Candidatus Lokiarchaeota archaeon]|nr:hypothetical protein [Candidatus Lokiarchaeota archaeon]
MNITQFNKELGKKIAIAQRFEKKGDIKAAIQQWVDISEMALNFSKSPKINASFKNMIINRTKGIFAHIKNLKASQFKEEIYTEDLETPKEVSEEEISPPIFKNEKFPSQEEELDKSSAINSTIDSQPDIIEDSDLKNLPKGFKEIKPSEEFKIITPHDVDFVEKQRAKAEESEKFKPKKQEASEGDTQPVTGMDFEQPKNGKYLICFACGYDKNALNDKICKNCGTDLN